MPSSSEIARVMAEMDRFNKSVTVTEERYEKRVASVGGSYGGLTALLQQGAPGNWASDHKSEAEKFSGWHYVAITSIGKAVRSSAVEAYQEKVREYAKGYNEQDEDTTPLPKWHPLMKLLKRPNPSQSGASFREEMAIQLCLTGSALVWNVPNQMGRTVERYVIPTAIAEPRQPEKGLPKGGWYINPEVARWQIESGWFLYTGLATAIGKVIDARDVQVVRFIHPVFKDEGQSPVSAGALWTDTSEKIDISRHAHLRNGSDPSVIIGIDGVEDEGTLQRMSAKFNEKYAGPSKHGKAMFVNGQNVKVEPVTRTPAEMAYEGAFAQFRDAIMALHGVTPVAAGIEAPSGDDGLYAPLKQFVVGTVQPILDLMAEEDTEQLASQFGEGVSVLYTARAIDDAKLTEQQINTDIAAGAIEVDEIRKLRGRKPWGGEKGKAVAGQGAKEEPQQGLPGLAQGVPGLETKPNGLEPQTGSQALDPSKPPKGTPDPMKLAEEAVAKALGGFADRLSALLKSGDNCGTGAGGFKPGNDCAGGGEGGEKPTKKKRGKKVAEESSGPKIEVFERGAGDHEFTSRGELIRGKLGELPITEGEPGLIEKLSKKTKAGIESAMADPDMVEDMKAGGIEALNIEPTNYYKKRTGRSGNWYGGYADGALTIHPKTVDHIESSAVEERVGGGLRRLISHEAGHGVWDKARDADKKAFAEAVKKNPEIVAYVSSVTNVVANPNAFNDTGSRVVTESFAEIHALRRYNREMYDSLPEDIRSPIESARKFGLELSERRAGWADRLKPKWQKSGSDCGANAEGGGGFQPGNTCGREDGSGESGGEDDYRGSHRSPGRDGGAPLDDMTGGGEVYPDDIYSDKAARYYGTGEPAMDRKSIRIIQSLRGNPDAEVTIYRAVPSHVEGGINPGDWVTINRDYAVMHGEGPLRGKYRILELKARAGDVYGSGDSIHEYGYDPAPKKKSLGKSGSSCGANAEGGGGFQPGNTCGKEDGAGEAQGETGKAKPQGAFAKAREAAKADLERIRSKVLEVAADYEKKIQEAKAIEESEWEKIKDATASATEEFNKLVSGAGGDRKRIDELYKRQGEKMLEIASEAVKAGEKLRSIKAEAKIAVAKVLESESKFVSDSLGLSKDHEEISSRVMTVINSPDGSVDLTSMTVKEDIRVWKSVTSGVDKKRRDDGLGFLSQICNPLFHQSALESKVDYRPFGERASAKNRDGEIWDRKRERVSDDYVGYSNIPLMSGPEVYVHEYGHQIEYGSGEIRNLTRDFLNSRTSGEEVVNFSEKFPESGYRDTEKGAKDGFAAAHEAAGFDKQESERRAYYVGKRYRAGHTEVLTMGLELMHKNPAAFAKSDPEWFDLVSGITTGRLLNGKQRELKDGK